MTTEPRGYVVRPARTDDLDAFRELRLEALRSHPEVFGSDYASNAAADESFWRERVRGFVDNERGIAFFAEAEGRLLGMIGIRRDDGAKVNHSAYIWGVYLRPEARGRGAADALVAACLGWARERKLRNVKLGVVTTNTAAIRCYARNGFTVYGIEPEVIHYDGRYYDELLMIRQLQREGAYS